jgi:predicted lipoprotein with Yx(FWY)xxD motif
MRYRQLVPVGVLAIGLLVAACGNSQGGTSGAGSTASPTQTAVTSGPKTVMLKTERTSLGTVLANSAGHTLYYLSIDSVNASKCSGSCLSIWPLVAGKPQAAPGMSISGTLSSFKRTDGAIQATWNGHPLYTYSGDTAAGQVNGNGINSFGGLWHAVVLSAAHGKPTPSPTSSSSGGGGYGG